jgi:hypothetical protein
MICYHVTAAANAPSILASGLQPRQSSPGPLAQDHVDCCPESVYLHTQLDVAENECDEGQVIFEVDLAAAGLSHLVEIDEEELIDLAEAAREGYVDDHPAGAIAAALDLGESYADARSASAALDTHQRAALVEYAAESGMAVRVVSSVSCSALRQL